MVGMPWGLPAAFRDGRDHDLRQRQRGKHRPGPLARHPQPGHPETLQDKNAPCVPQCRPAPRRVAMGRAQPMQDLCDPHNHEPGDAGKKVPGEKSWDPHREHEHAGHLQHRQQAVWDVVGVIGGGEPGVVHPRPPDGEERAGEGKTCLHHMVLGQPMVQLAGGQGDGDHKRQVEQQFQRRGHPARFVNVPALQLSWHGSISG